MIHWPRAPVELVGIVSLLEFPFEVNHPLKKRAFFSRGNPRVCVGIRKILLFQKIRDLFWTVLCPPTIV